MGVYYVQALCSAPFNLLSHLSRSATFQGGCLVRLFLNNEEIAQISHLGSGAAGI